MRDRAKMIIIGATVAASAAVPAIANAGNASNSASKVESTQMKATPPAATPTTAPVSATSSDDTGVETSDPTQDEAEVEVPATGTDLEKASAAALAHVGEGRVTGTEVGDEESYYEIEITLDDGRQLDIQLDEQFNFVSSEDDGVGSDD